MTEDTDKPYQKQLDWLVPVLAGLPWTAMLVETVKILWKVAKSWSYRGMYEVLEYESTLELKDRGGNRAVFRKREKVRYQQDSVIAYQDQAWGDGEILVNYRCTPGTPVDRYRSGFKTYVLISRREVKSRGEVDEFNIEWRIRKGFLRRTEQWETYVTHRTKELKVNVIFPKSRPPREVTLVEGHRQRSHELGQNAQRLLPDGRWQVSWETHNPRLYENYIIQWKW